ncbi:hypothetical protein HY00_10160 [Peptococcaceae bacterium SCADC1_2_3]|nr:hypothetical protein HY00_10160 [Peptococcaceae bacterium SCADC1_2_3]
MATLIQISSIVQNPFVFSLAYKDIVKLDEIIFEYNRFKNSRQEINQERIYTVAEKLLNIRLEQDLSANLQTFSKKLTIFVWHSNIEMRYIAISDIGLKISSIFHLAAFFSLQQPGQFF